MKRLLILFILLLALAGCADSRKDMVPQTEPLPSETEVLPVTTEPLPIETLPAETIPADPIQDMVDQMSPEERVGQIFLAGCNETVATEHIAQYHFGGMILFGANFRSDASADQKITNFQNVSRIPMLIAVDEEGGTVNRGSCFSHYRETPFASVRNLYNGGGMDWVLYQEAEKCALLGSLGINVNLGPVCDITTDPGAFMYRRSLGQNAAITSDCITQIVQLKNENNIGTALKHFPGYGNNADTHTGIAVDSRSLGELENNDLLPFMAGIEAGCGAVLVSHTIVECLDPDLPASLSPAVHQYLRNTMDFQGVIITDDLRMEAITDLYGPGEAAVLAVLAGNDLLCATEYTEQYEAVLAAVLTGRIDEDTLNSAVRNVLEWKQQLGLIFVG